MPQTETQAAAQAQVSSGWLRLSDSKPESRSPTLRASGLSPAKERQCPSLGLSSGCSRLRLRLRRRFEGRLLRACCL
eukprot:1769175-Rhodomonas_salina.5